MRFITYSCFWTSLYFAIVVSNPWLAFGQIKPGQQRSSVKIDQNNPVYQELKGTHQRLVSELRSATKSAFEAGIRFSADEQNQAEKHRQDYIKAVEKGKKVKEQLYDTTLKLLEYEPTQDMVFLAMAIHENEFNLGRYERARMIGQKLLEVSPEGEKLEQSFDWPRIRQAYIEYTRDNFDYALNEFQYAVNMDRIDFEPHLHMQVVKETLFTTIEAWKKEVAIRAAEKEKDDLPRVEIETTKGTFVVELYEDQAPETVANFIHLVEQGFYDGSKFLPVIRHQYAASGRSADGIPTAGWAIRDESQREDARHFFGYTLGMRKTYQGKLPMTEFLITFKADPNLNSNQIETFNLTAFGRVIEGKDAIDHLTATHNLPKEEGENELKELSVENPDKIISAKVIRKRGHEYVPEKLGITTGTPKQ